ncbi:MAG: hypothetical protein WCF59_10925 [Desulfobaccales bacterium]
MPVIDYREVLKGLMVQEAMRRQVTQIARRRFPGTGHSVHHQIQSQCHLDYG